MKNKIAIMILLSAAVITGCKKVQRTGLIEQGYNPAGTARLKVVYAAPGLKPMNVLVNGLKINGANLSYGSVFPTPSTNSDYSVVTAGTGSVSMIYPATAVRPDSVYKALPYAFLGDKYYSLIITDSVARTGKAIFLTDEFGGLTDSGYYKLRFVNAMANATSNVDVFSVRQGVNIASNVPYTGATAFVKLQIKGFISGTGALVTTDTLIMRNAGTATELARLNGFAPSNQRSITLYARGNYTLSSGTTARSLQTYFNY